MLKTLNGMFSEPKPHRINFIKENKKKLKETSNMVYQNNMKSRIDVTRTRGSQTEVNRSTSESSAILKENKRSSCKLNNKVSAAAFLHEIKDKANISNQSLSSNQTSAHNIKLRSSQKLVLLKNQSSQTIDPRRCDQLFHDGIIKYPSNKILQELAEIEKQKANRLDAHVKKEYFKRNKIHQKNTKKVPVLSLMEYKKNGKGDEPQEVNHNVSEEEKEEEKPKEEIQESEPEPEPQMKVSQKEIKQPHHHIMRAAEIIRKTTEDINNRVKSKPQTEFNPTNVKTGLKLNKSSKKLPKDEEILKTVLDPQCPPGHIPLPDSERKKTLYMLRVSHAELVREMNLLPVRTDTLRVRQKKIHLENQLNKIEEGIKVFSKSKVYVKIEE